MSKVEILVCTKCRMGLEIPKDETRPGAAFFDSLSQIEMPEGVSVRAVECLSNCSNGCTVALRGGTGRWSYIYGNLDPSQTDDVLEGAMKYAASNDGIVPWRERPEHFRKNCIARIPPEEF